MKKELRLLALIGEAKDTYLQEAEQEWAKGKMRAQQRRWRKGRAFHWAAQRKAAAEPLAGRKEKKRMLYHFWGAAAATLVLVGGILGLTLGTLQLHWQSGSDADSGGTAGGGAGIETGDGTAGGGAGIEAGDETGGGGAGAEHAEVFMSYAGPVFPLILKENSEKGEENALIASREIQYAYQKQDKTGMVVTDTYEITNLSKENVAVTAYYPYQGSLQDYGRLRPSVQIEGKEQQTQTYVGASCGGTLGVLCADCTRHKVCEGEPEGWQAYQELLADGQYFNQAIERYEALDTPLTVYEFSDFQAPLEAYPAATQAISFFLDETKSQVVTYGFEGYAWEEESKKQQYSFFVPKGEEKKLLLVWGEDLKGYELTGYQDGGCEESERLSQVKCKVQRREMTVGEVLAEVLPEFLKRYLPQEALALQETAGEEDLGQEGATKASQEVLSQEQRRLCEGDIQRMLSALEEHFVSKDAEPQKVQFEDLIVDAFCRKRVLYECFSLTVPAGETVRVSAELFKEPSFDFDCADTQQEGVWAYDLVTSLGSELRFSKVTAELKGSDSFELVEQNFGFDLQRGITRVELSMQQEHYYMKLKEK